MWRQGDHERVAQEIHGLAGFQPTEVHGPADLALRLLGPESLRFRSSERLCGRASRALWNGVHWVIALREDLARDCWAAEIAYHLAAIHLDGAAPEDELLRVAYAILMPAPAMQTAIAAFGVIPEVLADVFATTREHVVERLADLVVAPTPKLASAVRRALRAAV